MLLLENVLYHISPSITSERRELIEHLLVNNGAKLAPTLANATHIITNSNRFEGWDEIKEGVVVVTEKWLEKTLLLGKLQPAQFFSPDPAMIFSGVIACATDLPSQDLEVLSAGILALGGQWRTGLTKEVTHLFAIEDSSHKYQTALHFQEHTHIKVVLPHWFDDAVKLGTGSLDTKPYEWPDPPLLRNAALEEEKPNEKEKEKVKKATSEADPLKKSVFSSSVKYGLSSPVVGASSSPTKGPSSSELQLAAPVKQVWGGKRVLLARNLLLFGSRREAVEIGIKRAGGEVIRWDGDEEEEKETDTRAKKSARERLEAKAVEGCDVYISRWREGRGYVRAFKMHKTIGTLAWLYHVQSSGTITRPLDQLLHYPIPNRPIERFNGHEITVTNYTGEAREYLKKLITIMGATFTPSMSGRNTVLIAASKSGTKAVKAMSWSIPVVNHTWLEDCFVRWRMLTTATEKYITFPEGIDFSALLGERGVGVEMDVIKEEVEEMGDESDVEAEVEEEEVSEGEREDMGMEFDGMMGTAGSMKEVEALVDNDGDAHMHDDEDDEPPLPPPRKSPVKTKTPVKPKPATPKDKSRATSDDSHTEDEEDEDEPTPVKPKQVSPRKEKSKPVGASRGRSMSQGRVGTHGMRTRSQSRSRRRASSDEEDDRRRGRASNAKKSSPVKPKAKANDEEEERGRGRGRRGRSKSKSRSRPPSESRMRTRSQSRSRREKYGHSGSSADEDDEPPRGKPKAKPKPKPTSAKRARTRSQSRGQERSRSRGRAKQVVEVRGGSTDESSSDDDIGLILSKPKKAANPPSASKSKAKASPAKVQQDAKKGGRKSGRVMSDTDSEDDEIEVLENIQPKSRGSNRRKARSEDEESEVEEVPEKKAGPSKGKKVPFVDVPAKPASHGGKKRTAVQEDESEEEEPPKKKPAPSSSAKKKSPAKKGRVEEESELSELSEEEEDKPKSKGKAAAAKGKGKGKEAASKAARASTGTAKGKGKKRTAEDSEEDEDAMDLDKPESESDEDERPPAKPASRRRSNAKASTSSAAPPPAPAPESTVSHGHSKRLAATKATAKLHDVIMPDVISFESQMRKSKKSGRKSGVNAMAGFVVEGDTPVDEEVTSQKKDGSGGGGKRKKRASEVREASPDSDEAEEVEEEEEVPEKKKRKVKAAAVRDEDDEQEERREVKLATTQVNLPDDVVRTLGKLGVTMTSKPSDCTHLLAAGVVRTEKFLCAIANAGYILKKEWALDSAKANKLLPEGKYMLNDPGNKHGVDLAATLERAKKGKLFQGKTFYVAGKSISTSFGLLKNVVVVSGGQLKEVQKLTQRIIAGGPERYAVSAQEDVSVWRQLSEAGSPVYSMELIISSTLHQKFDPNENMLKPVEESD